MTTMTRLSLLLSAIILSTPAVAESPYNVLSRTYITANEGPADGSVIPVVPNVPFFIGPDVTAECPDRLGCTVTSTHVFAMHQAEEYSVCLLVDGQYVVQCTRGWEPTAVPKETNSNYVASLFYETQVSHGPHLFQTYASIGDGNLGTISLYAYHNLYQVWVPKK